MSEDKKQGSKCRARSILCSIAMVFGILTIVAITTALAIRLLEMGDPNEAGKSLFHFLHLNDAAVEADKAQRKLLWIWAFVDLALALAATGLAVAAARAHSLTVVLLLFLFGAGTTVAAFFLAWPLGILAAVIPIMAALILPMSRNKCATNS
ncbi:MAG: hypothetical protein P8M22_03180 [Phycisphaerales bacterium]|nr:hypothetical protein [Phycisphaerales bacterium]